MLAGRYRLLEQLGEGGMGSVWKAEHLLLHSQVAIKIIDPDVARLEFNLARFLREAKTLATLRSPNVVQVLDFGSDADTPYLVMELLEGQTLGRRLTERGRLSLIETSRVMNDVCTAMSLVHEQGLIHRDLKPENIFLCDNGEQLVTKVVDFGIAKSLRGDMSASMKTRTGHMLGTPSYMSPEQCRGLKDIDHRADLWALGVITYECLVGKVPFEGEVLGDLLLRICMDPLPIPSRNVLDVDVKGALPAAYDAWFAKAVARDRAERYQSAAELASSLAELASSLGLAATHDARGGAARELPDVLEPSRPSLPWVSPAPSRVTSEVPSRVPAGAPARAPSATPRQPSHTETNTTIGLVGAALKVDRRARALAVAVVALSAALGLWAVGNQGAAGGAESVDVRSLRPPFEVAPKTIRPGVPSGRRWQAASGPEGAVLDRTPTQGSTHEPQTTNPAPRDALTVAGAASAAPPETVVANVAPAVHLPPSASPGMTGPSAGSAASGAAAHDGASPDQGASESPGAPSAPARGSTVQPTPGAPEPAAANADGAPAGPPVPPSATPPRALRGTAAPHRARDASETSIRRAR